MTSGNEAGVIRVTGTAHLDAKPDKVIISAAFWESVSSGKGKFNKSPKPKDLQSSKKDLENRILNLAAYLDEVGIGKGVLKTGTFRVERVKADPGIGGIKEEEVYLTRVLRTVSLVSHDVDDISSVLNALTTQGVNIIQGVHYQLENPESLQTEAVKKATSNAKEKAQGMAEALGVSLLSLVEVREDAARHRLQSDFNDHKLKSRAFSGMALYRKSSEEPEEGYHNPDTINVSASVDAVWQVG
ncbi:SIMPL domain-containing protein [Halomonas aquatica]|uniref:SIMPL domain-containing protein n=1 Tax=Halomonas aquatica TaxID=3151123 RepID=A0ABV1NAH7_9GAMM